MHHPKLREISARIDEILGLNFPKNRLGDLERGLLSAAKELGLVVLDNWAICWKTGM